MKKKIVHPLAFHAEDLKVKCPMEEKKKKETKYTLAFLAEGKNPWFAKKPFLDEQPPGIFSGDDF